MLHIIVIESSQVLYSPVWGDIVKHYQKNNNIKNKSHAATITHMSAILSILNLNFIKAVEN